MYFAYGSNLWLEQMARRCPKSTYEGVARLTEHRWMINSRGYANIVSTHVAPDTHTHADTIENSHTYGLVYSLNQSDEAALDGHEGVPEAYTKETMVMDFWPKRNGDESIDVTSRPERAELLVYIDRRRTKDDRPKREYVTRMNHGIIDAERLGIPRGYIESVMRPVIPEQSAWDAKRQAEKRG